MTLKRDRSTNKSEKTQPGSNIFQSILRNVQATSVHIDRIVQNVIYVSIGSLNEQQRRCFLCVVFGLSITLMMAGFFKLYEEGCILQTKLFLVSGCLPAFLICLYYAFFWQSPNIPPQSEPPLNPLDSVDLESLTRHIQDPELKRYKILAKEKKLKKRYKRECDRYQESEQRRNKILKQVRIFKRLAAVIMVSFLVITGVVVWYWSTIPSHAITLAKYKKYYLVKKDNLSDDGEHIITQKLMARLKRDTEDFEIKPINKAFEWYEREKVRREAAQRKASVAIWGSMTVNNSGKKDPSITFITNYFEILKEALVLELPNQFWAEYQENEGQYGIEIDDINFGFKDAPVNLVSKNLSYLANFTSGLAYYIALTSRPARYTAEERELVKNTRKSFEKALENLGHIKHEEPLLPKEILDKKIIDDYLKNITYFYLGNTHLVAANFSKSEKGYDLAISSFTKAIDSVSKYILVSDRKRQDVYIGMHDHKVIPVNYISQFGKQSDSGESDDAQGIICDSRIRNINVLVDGISPPQLKVFLARIYHNRGIAYAMKGNNERALADYAKALEFDSELDAVCNSLGIAYADKGNYKSAILNLDRAISANPEDAIAYNSLGNIYAAQGKYQQAITQYNKAIKLNPNFAEAYYNRSRVYLIRGENGNSSQSIKDVSKAIKLKPNSADIYYYVRGKDYLSLGKYDKAIEDFGRVISSSGANQELRQDAEQKRRQICVEIGYSSVYSSVTFEADETLLPYEIVNIEIFSLDDNSSTPVEKVNIRASEKVKVDCLTSGTYRLRGIVEKTSRKVQLHEIVISLSEGKNEEVPVKIEFVQDPVKPFQPFPRFEFQP